MNAIFEPYSENTVVKTEKDEMHHYEDLYNKNKTEENTSSQLNDDYMDPQLTQFKKDKVPNRLNHKKGDCNITKRMLSKNRFIWIIFITVIVAILIIITTAALKIGKNKLKSI
jgi:hypothetical protein